MTSAAVLLVEDNDINRDMLTRRLTRAGLTVIGAADGQTALDRMRSDSPAVVLMDMTLPVLDGWDACEQAKADPDIAHIPIIALTAHAMARRIRMAHAGPGMSQDAAASCRGMQGGACSWCAGPGATRVVAKIY